MVWNGKEFKVICNNKLKLHSHAMWKFFKHKMRWSEDGKKHSQLVRWSARYDASRWIFNMIFRGMYGATVNEDWLSTHLCKYKQPYILAVQTYTSYVKIYKESMWVVWQVTSDDFQWAIFEEMWIVKTLYWTLIMLSIDMDMIPLRCWS